jgi:hypothetical protein
MSVFLIHAKSLYMCDRISLHSIIEIYQIIAITVSLGRHNEKYKVQ